MDGAIFNTLELEAKHEEIGVPRKWYKFYDATSFAEKFPSLSDFLDTYDNDDFGCWTLSVMRENIDISFVGKRTETEVGVGYAKDKSVNLLSALGNVESQSYEYNSFDKALIDILKNDYKMTIKRAVQMLIKLRSIKIFTRSLSALLPASRQLILPLLWRDILPNN